LDKASGSVVDDETPKPISQDDITGRNAEFYSFITSIIKLGRKIEMDDVEFKSDEGGISAKFKRVRIE
jgi:Tfp pilus assembly protein PilO